ncbi:MAG: hypothetical protein ACREH3_10535, partial [Geminicoccales bacterium]
IVRRMETATQLLGAMGLLIGALDYTLLIRRRAEARRRARDAESVEQSGLQGLVRVLLAD